MLRVFPRSLRNQFIVSRHLSTVAQQDVDSEYTDEAVYPPIMDDSRDAIKAREKNEWHMKIKRIGTIEEKMIELNIPKYYGYKCVMIDDKEFPYNTLQFLKYATNTEFVEESHASSGEEENKKVDNFFNLIKSDVQDAFEFELDAYKKRFDIRITDMSAEEINRAKTSGIVRQVNRILINSLGADNRHLYELDADIDARHEAFWFVGGVDPTLLQTKIKKGRPSTEKYADEPYDRPFQYIGKPFLALRHQLPLQPFEDIDFESITSKNETIAPVTIDPRAFGYKTDYRHGTTIPGFWPGNVREYGFISFQDRNFMNSRNNAAYGEKDRQEALHSQAILSSYAWTYAQACYQGFSTYNDMNYSLPTQTVITDGQFWSFYKYQLNTTCIHTSPIEPNYRYNKCWGTKEMKLYDQIDDHGKLQGINDEVLKNLIKLYINEPQARNYEMKPFLDPKERKIADIEDLKRRDWLEKTFKHIMSNRPRHKLVPEIYCWEKIYKIDHDTKPLARRSRFFELGINPFHRKLNEHWPKYLPRHERARGHKDKKRWDATYYPLDHKMNIPKEEPHSMVGASRSGNAGLYDRKRKSFK